MVQIIARKDIRTATPSGHSVAFWIPHANPLDWNLGSPFAAIGMISIVITKHAILIALPTELKFAIQRVGMLLIQA